MQTIERKNASFDDLYFQVDLTGYDKTGDDVEDIFFSVKIKLDSLDDDVFLKTYATSGILFTEDTPGILNVVVHWDYDEYANIVINRTYKAGLFIKFIGDPVADEHVNQIFELVVKEDFLRS